jgi:hypothetical protein
MQHEPIINKSPAYPILAIISFPPPMVLIISESYQHPNGTMAIKNFSNIDLITLSLHPSELPSPAYEHT